jgi:hypothetical protein
MPPRKLGNSALSIDASGDEEEKNFGNFGAQVDHALGKTSDKRNYYHDLEAETRGEVSNSRKRRLLAVVFLCALVWITLLGALGLVGDSQTSSVTPTASIGDAAYYYKHWCNNSDLNGGAMQFLDDKFCLKIFPRNTNRELTCEGMLTDIQDLPAGYIDVSAIRDSPNLNVTLLEQPEATVPGLSIGVIVVRRTLDGRTFFKQFGNHLSSVPVETWSSSKIFVAAAAGVRLHDETECSDFGLHSYVSSLTHQEVPLGDLATVIASYDLTAGYTSNSLAYFFSGVAQRNGLQQILSSGSCASLFHLVISIEDFSCSAAQQLEHPGGLLRRIHAKGFGYRFFHIFRRK